MENKKYNIEKEVRKAMDSIDNIQRVEGNPYLSTRLQERLRQQNDNNVTTHSQVPVWQLAMVIGLFILNGFVLVQSGYIDIESTVAVEEVEQENWLVNSKEEDLNYISWND